MEKDLQKGQKETEKAERVMEEKKVEVKGERMDIIAFGMLCRDILTGFEGYAISRYTWITGCDRYQLMSKKDIETNNTEETRSFDLGRLEVIDKIGLTEKMAHMNKSTDIENAKFKFGDEVKDKLTKFKGVVGSICVSMNGDISVGLSQEYSNMAKDTSMWWFDEGRVELVKSAKIALTTPKEEKKEEKPKRTGGIATRPEGVYR